MPLSSVSAFLNSSFLSRGSGIHGRLHLFHNSADTSKSLNSTILTKNLLFPAVFSRNAESPYGPSSKMSAIERQSLKITWVPQVKDAGMLDEMK